MDTAAADDSGFFGSAGAARVIDIAFARPGRRRAARTCNRGISWRSAIRRSNTDSSRGGRRGRILQHRAPKAWLKALAPLGTDSNKPFLEIAPWLIAVFAQPFRTLADGTRSPTYYAIESVGIATGMLVTAVHSCGLTALTHTPSPMGFLNRILGRPSREKPFVLLVVGHPAQNARVPDIGRKSPDKISSFIP
jgi:hypothetical protein